MKSPRTYVFGTVAIVLLFAASVTARMLEEGATRSQTSSDQGASIKRARAAIKGEGISGEATFEEAGTGILREVRVRLTVKGPGIKDGLHGVHLHEVGKCEPPFAAAGGHFDPGPAGNSDPDVNHPFHLGDLPTLVVKNNEGTLNAVTTRVTLSPGPLSLFDTDGSAVIVHANEDAGKPGEAKSGISGGPRAACGVIEKH